MASSWMGLKGSIQWATGTSGTVTLASGSRVLQVLCHASTGGATVNVLGRGNTPVPNAADWFRYQANHADNIAGAGGGALTIVFTSTDSYVVEYIGPAGLS
jgi:hypothetical protein